MGYDTCCPFFDLFFVWGFGDLISFEGLHMSTTSVACRDAGGGAGASNTVKSVGSV